MKLAHSVQHLQPSYIREILKAASSPDIISLAGGLPAQEYFPLGLMESAIKNLVDHPRLFQYGETIGYQPLITFLKQLYKTREDDGLLVTSGSQQGLDLIARAFINPGDKVVLETPSYIGALQVFSLAQADLITVSLTTCGPNTEELETLFAKGDVKFFYAIPDFHNPTGISWDMATRKRVAELCAQYKVCLIEDCPYRELRFRGEELPLVSSLCPDHAFVLRSFSKIATPGIRIGAVTALSEWINTLVKVKQAADLHTAIPMQHVLLELLSHEKFPEHIEQIRNVYGERCDALLNALDEKLSHLGKANPVDGGMFLWFALNANIDPMRFAQNALKVGVAVVPSSVFYKQHHKHESSLRLNFSNTPPDKLQKAVSRLSEIKVDSL
ncbi:MAG: PLP-dependent aminotransferase family protein [Gammaproteobacteria bacterium]|nr:MAG: PLP-dependent aminotransferase family protein [Gammaproteobacteria bacterium]